MAKSYNKLRGKIIEVFGSQREFAKALGKTEQSVTAKLNMRTDFSQGDIIQWSELLGIAKEEINQYFFKTLLSKW